MVICDVLFAQNKNWLLRVPRDFDCAGVFRQFDVPMLVESWSCLVPAAILLLLELLGYWWLLHLDCGRQNPDPSKLCFSWHYSFCSLILAPVFFLPPEPGPQYLQRTGPFSVPGRWAIVLGSEGRRSERLCAHRFHKLLYALEITSLLSLLGSGKFLSTQGRYRNGQLKFIVMRGP